MIRYKEKEFEQWSICPATGDIFDAKTGEVQPVKLYGGRPSFKCMPVHQIMAHTFLGGYKPGYNVHHKDENKLNNALGNLIYLTRSEHRRLHATELLHDETRVKMSAARKGKTSPNKGKTLSAELRAKLSAAHKGKIPSAETRAKMSKSRKGKTFSVEHKAKMSASIKGRHCWHNSSGEVKFTKECPGLGWLLGRK